jgi:DNA-binding response OmpR family regulator
MLVTSLEDEVDQLVGYRLGAVDYVVKPVSPKVLAEKVKSFTSRIVEGDAPPQRTVVGPLVIEHDAHRVLADDAEVLLTRLEYGPPRHALAQVAATAATRRDPEARASRPRARR